MALDYLKLHTIVFVWGFTAILGRWITKDSCELVFYRTLMACIAMGLICFWRRIPIVLPRGATALLVLIGGIVGLHWLTFFFAIKISGASVALAGLSTATIWTAFIAPFFEKRSISKAEIFLGGVVVFGLYLIYRFEINQSAGLFLGVVSAFLAAVFSAANHVFVRKFHHFTISLYQMLGACIAAVAILPVFKMFTGEPTDFSLGWQDLGGLLILALVCTVYPYAASVELLKRMSVFSVNLSINMEPVYGMILAALLLHEHQVLNQGFYIGAMVIVASIMVYPILKRRES